MSLTRAQYATAQRLLDDGCSYRETARTLGVGRASVMKALPGYGWTYREAGQFRAATRDRAAERRSA